MRITAIVTAYHPDELLAGVVESALAACEAVIVVDNTPRDEAGNAPGSSARGLEDPRVTVLADGSNLGLAGALNLGIAALPEWTEAVLLLDQDSVIPDGLIEGLAKDLDDPSVGIVGPSPVDALSGRRYETLAGRHKQLDERDVVITSGMLLRREHLEKVPGGFREDFFVDYVDVDFCLRAQRNGVRIVRDMALELPHSIGDVRIHRFLGKDVKIGHHAAWRHYWTVRNGVILIREHLARKPVWAALNTLFLARWIAHILLFEPERRTHAPAALRGLADGLTGRLTRRFIPAGAQYRGRPEAAPGPARSSEG
jgi:rhamnosyltransferase